MAFDLFGGSTKNSQTSNQTTLSSAGANSPIVNGSVTITDPSLAGFANNALVAVSGVAKDSQAAAAAALATAQATVANSQSGGQTNNNKTLVYLVGIVAALVAAVYIWKK